MVDIYFTTRATAIYVRGRFGCPGLESSATWIAERMRKLVATGTRHASVENVGTFFPLHRQVKDPLVAFDDHGCKMAIQGFGHAKMLFRDGKRGKDLFRAGFPGGWISLKLRAVKSNMALIKAKARTGALAEQNAVCEVVGTLRDDDRQSLAALVGRLKGVYPKIHHITVCFTYRTVAAAGYLLRQGCTRRMDYCVGRHFDSMTTPLNKPERALAVRGLLAWLPSLVILAPVAHLERWL